MGDPVPVDAPNPDPAGEPFPPVNGYGRGATAHMPSQLPYGYTHEKVALIKSAASRTIKINTDGPPIPTITSKTGDGRSSCRGGL